MSAIHAPMFSGGDPYWNSVVFLCHFDGPNNSTSTIDESHPSRVITFTDQAKISTSQSKFGGASAVFDGYTDRVTATTDANDVFGSGDFTVELHVYIETSHVANEFPIFWGGATATGWGVEIQADGHVSWWNNNARQHTWFTALSGTWRGIFQNITFVRRGTDLTLYINGVSQGAATNSVDYTNSSSSALYIGAKDVTTAIVGYVDEVRLTKGVARYTSNFTPPTVPFPNS